jgi:cytidine deaminase
MTFIQTKAIKKAQQSLCRYRISALGLNRKGEIIGSSINKTRFDHKGGGLHAESNLISKYGNQLKTIIICRVGLSGNILPIHPCVNCSSLADKFDIKIKTISEI